MTTDTLTANAVIWTEIPVADLSASMKFYAALTGQELTLEDGGPGKIAVFACKPGGVAGHLYPGKPAPKGCGPTVHLVVPGTVEEAAAACIAAGGEVLGEIITIPPGRFQYALDIDGNSIGLFEGNA